MKYTENMTFEEASKALIDELNANRQHFIRIIM